MKNAIFILPGNCRTFIQCIDSCYNHVISKLFKNTDYNIHIYLYLKIADPGPKGQYGWDFSYEPVNYSILVDKIEEVKNKYNLNIEYKILDSDELTNAEILGQIKDRSKFTGYFFGKDSFLSRAMQCHYNIEKCYEYIIEKETKESLIFDKIIYIRPDLFFTEDCETIDKYSDELITLGVGPIPYEFASDHYAIIPRHHLRSFCGMINIYRNNTDKYHELPEYIYYDTVKGINESKVIGRYYIKRN